MRIRIMFLIAMCLTHVASPTLSAQQPTPREPTFQIQKGKAGVVRLDRAAARVVIADTTVATFQLIDSRQLIIRGVNPGKTRMTVILPDSTQRIYIIDVLGEPERTVVEVTKGGVRQQVCFGPGCETSAGVYVRCASAITGNLGFTLRCNGGECSMDRTDDTAVRNVFTVEPIVESITPRGPAEGRLRTGDIIVAVDGFLITTRDASERLVTLATGDSVALRVRRGGREELVHVVSTLGCRLPERFGLDLAPNTNRLYQSARLYLSRSQQYESALNAARLASSPPGEPTMPIVDFGISLECDWCGWRRIGSQITWWSYEAPRVNSADAQGPAAVAGIRTGDILISVNGARFVNSHLATSGVWAALKPGVAATLVVQRAGEQLEIRVIPRAGRRPF